MCQTGHLFTLMKALVFSSGRRRGAQHLPPRKSVTHTFCMYPRVSVICAMKSGQNGAVPLQRVSVFGIHRVGLHHSLPRGQRIVFLPAGSTAIQAGTRGCHHRPLHGDGPSSKVHRNAKPDHGRQVSSARNQTPLQGQFHQAYVQLRRPAHLISPTFTRRCIRCVRPSFGPQGSSGGTERDSKPQIPQ